MHYIAFENRDTIHPLDCAFELAEFLHTLTGQYYVLSSHVQDLDLIPRKALPKKVGIFIHLSRLPRCVGEPVAHIKYELLNQRELYSIASFNSHFLDLQTLATLFPQHLAHRV